jgi:hypothetical protein
LPFRDTGTEPLDWLDLGNGHFVRATRELLGRGAEKAA